MHEGGRRSRRAPRHRPEEAVLDRCQRLVDVLEHAPHGQHREEADEGGLPEREVRRGVDVRVLGREPQPRVRPRVDDERLLDVVDRRAGPHRIRVRDDREREGRVAVAVRGPSRYAEGAVAGRQGQRLDGVAGADPAHDLLLHPGEEDGQCVGVRDHREVVVAREVLEGEGLTVQRDPARVPWRLPRRHEPLHVQAGDQRSGDHAHRDRGRRARGRGRVDDRAQRPHVDGGQGEQVGVERQLDGRAEALCHDRAPQVRVGGGLEGAASHDGVGPGDDLHVGVRRAQRELTVLEREDRWDGDIDVRENGMRLHSGGLVDRQRSREVDAHHQGLAGRVAGHRRGREERLQEQVRPRPQERDRQGAGEGRARVRKEERLAEDAFTKRDRSGEARVVRHLCLRSGSPARDASARTEPSNA